LVRVVVQVGRIPAVRGRIEEPRDLYVAVRELTRLHRNAQLGGARQEAAARVDREAIGTGREGHLRTAARLERGKERAPAEEFDQRLLAGVDGDAGVERGAVRGAGNGKGDAPGPLEAAEVTPLGIVGGDLERRGSAARV